METIVEGSRLERAGTGEDLLSKIPGISVKDGKVSVFGGGNVTEVYINGRLVRNDTDLCRLESADVRSVELVRNPGARYKASAWSVIRIFTKKNKDEGFSLDNRAEIYNRFKWTASDQLGLSYRKGGMEITGNMFGRYMNHSDNKTAVEETFSDKVMTSVTTMYAPQKWVYLSPNMSFNYMFDERNSAGDDNNFRYGDCWQFDFSVYKGFLEDRLNIQLQGEDMFRTGRPEWRLYCDRYVQTVSEENRRTIRLTLRYKLNPSESKYRGTGAGRSQRYRM